MQPCIHNSTMQNTVVAISPYESHLDPRLYDDALSYNPHRNGMMLDTNTPTSCSNSMRSSVIGVGGLAGLSFGGGKYRCPGRSFAEMELAMLISIILVRYDVHLVSGRYHDGFRGFDTAATRGSTRYPGDESGLLPPPDISKLVGIKVPKGACWVEVQRRSS